jgi:hypothetical protein
MALKLAAADNWGCKSAGRVPYQRREPVIISRGSFLADWLLPNRNRWTRLLTGARSLFL